ncbi:MAG: PTS transporter subunit EIIB [Erysipelotrichaceae bacterium]|nr:PTS transporter subunit EIIB [Erysipelotrichaceae bacterium]
MDYQKMHDQIVEACGGAENIVNVTHCATRLRIVVADEEKYDDNRIKTVEGVINTIKVGNQHQLIIGQEVKDLYSKMFTGYGGAVTSNGFNFKDFLGNVAGFMGAVMGPVIIPMMACGLIKMVLGFTLQWGWLTAESGTYIVLSWISDLQSTFQPIFVGYGVAKRLNTSPVVGMLVACSLISPVFTKAIAEGTPLSVFGINVGLVNYSGNTLATLLVCVLAAYLEKGIGRILPKTIKDLFCPLLVLVITAPLGLGVVGPLAAKLTAIIAQPLLGLSNVMWLLLPIVCVLMPYLIMFAMHGVFFGFTFSTYFPMYGYDPLAMPASFLSHCAMGATSLAVALKSKQRSIKQLGFSSCATIWLSGISEPCIFGILIQNKYSMIGCAAGSLVASIIYGIFAIKYYVPVGTSALYGIVAYITEKPFIGVLGMVVSIVVSFVVTYTIYKDPEVNNIVE